MQLVTVGNKYQIVIPKEVRRKMKGLRPGSKVGISLKDENTASIKTEPKSWVERSVGIAKEAWAGIDPIVELEKIRNEWEQRLEEQAKIWESKNATSK